MADMGSAETEVALSGEFRGRQRSFHSVTSYHKTGSKRSAAVPLDFAHPQRPRLTEESLLSTSAPITSLSSTIVHHSVVLPLSNGSDGTSRNVRVLVETLLNETVTTRGDDGNDQTEIPCDITDSSSPAVKTIPECPEVEGEERRPRRIVRPEDISLYNPDSGLGYRASKNEYHTDDSDDGQDDDDDDSEKEDGEITEPDDHPSSHPYTPEIDPDLFIPHSPSPSQAEPLEDGKIAPGDGTLPYTTPLNIKLNFDPSVHMGLLMIDPSHQDRFNQLYPPLSSSQPSTAYETLLQQYEAANATRFENLEHALLLNTELDDVDEVVEVIEEEDFPPANPPSSPTFLPVTQ